MSLSVPWAAKFVTEEGLAMFLMTLSLLAIFSRLRLSLAESVEVDDSEDSLLSRAALFVKQGLGVLAAPRVSSFRPSMKNFSRLAIAESGESSLRWISSGDSP